MKRLINVLVASFLIILIGQLLVLGWPNKAAHGQITVWQADQHFLDTLVPSVAASLATDTTFINAIAAQIPAGGYTPNTDLGGSSVATLVIGIGHVTNGILNPANGGLGVGALNDVPLNSWGVPTGNIAMGDSYTLVGAARATTDGMPMIFGENSLDQMSAQAANYNAGNFGLSAGFLNGNTNNTIYPTAPRCLVQGTSSTYLPMNALGNGTVDDTTAIQNALLCQAGMTSYTSAATQNASHPRVRLPYTSACYKISQPLRVFGNAADFGGDEGKPFQKDGPTQLCPTWTGGASVVAEAPGEANLAYVTALGGTGTAMSTTGVYGSREVILSDMINSGTANFGTNTAFGVAVVFNITSIGDGVLWQYQQVTPAYQALDNSVSVVAAITTDSSHHTICTMHTSGSGNVTYTSATTGLTLNANHQAEIDWSGSAMYCFLDGTLLNTGGTTATGTLTAGFDSGLFDVSTLPDVIGVNNMVWPDVGGTNGPAGTFDSINISNAALHTASYSTSLAKPTATANTQLLVNFETNCTSVAQSNCSPDGMQLGHFGLSGITYLPIRTINQNSASPTNNAHLHDLDLCTGSALPDGLFALWENDGEFDHLSCGKANSIAFNFYSNDFFAKVHDDSEGFYNVAHHLGFAFGQSYNDSFDWNLDSHSTAVGFNAACVGGGAQEDANFAWSPDSTGAIGFLYNQCSSRSVGFQTDIESGLSNFVANFYFFQPQVGSSVTGGYLGAGASTAFIRHVQGASMKFQDITGVASSGTPAAFISYFDQQFGGGSPGSTPDTVINVGLPTSGGNEIPVTTPANLAHVMGDSYISNAAPLFSVANMPVPTHVPASATTSTICVSDATSCTGSYTGSGSDVCTEQWNGTAYAGISSGCLLGF